MGRNQGAIMINSEGKENKKQDTEQEVIINLVDDMVDRLTEVVKEKFTPDEVEDFNDGTDPV